ncbi:MAG: UDP-3-O-acyl-N-acetylglucosamine deacetylase [Deltaproteobacteria bacterium]
MNETILIVDDDATVRQSIGGVLRDEGFSVLTAGSGQEAICCLADSGPHLVLLDVWMPEMDGIELLTRIRQTHADLPVIVLSGHGNVEVAVRATKLGAVDFIEKPFSIEGLLASVNQALNKETGTGQGAGAQQSAGTIARQGTGPLLRQRTLARSVIESGLGLHSGARTGLILQPLPAGSGIRFGRVAGEGWLEAVVDNVDSTGYATTLFKDGLTVRTVEHLMAAFHAYGITNLLVKVEGEVPILDGSAVEFCRLIESAGIEEQDAEVAAVCVEKELRVGQGDSLITAKPYDGLRITYELSYPEPVGEQTYTFEMDGPEAFKREIAPARTFGFVEEIRQLENAGLGQGGQLGNFILIGESGIVNTELRFTEELARHKILDVLGDLYLLGAPLRASIHARKTGHRDNIAMVRVLQDLLV